MWQRFREGARKAIFYAMEEAQTFRAHAVSTEHLLLGVIRDHDSVARQVLGQIGLQVDDIRFRIEALVTLGSNTSLENITLSPRAKRVIDLAYDEARNLNNNYIGTEHLILAIIREGDGIGDRVLRELGADLNVARAAVRRLQGQEPVKYPEEKPTPKKVHSSPPTSNVNVLSLLMGGCMAEHLVCCLLTEELESKSQVIGDQCQDIPKLFSTIQGLIEDASRSSLQQTPAEPISDLLALAQREARDVELQTHHFLLAFLHPEREGRLKEALVASGLTYERTLELTAKEEA